MQSEKAVYPISVKLSGIVTDVNSGQFEKESTSVTVFDITNSPDNAVFIVKSLPPPTMDPTEISPSCIN